MNEEIMKLYKEHGVNPLGGCLPMALQLPFLYGFYRVLDLPIELRHAPWILWIKDLSAPDKFHPFGIPLPILPTVMVITMFIMQKMTPVATADPAQQRMMMFMPIVFGIMFYNFASGLVLYFLTANMVGILQQVLINKLMPMPQTLAGPGNTPEVKDRSSMDSQNAAQTPAHSLESYLAPIESLLKQIIQQGGFALSFAIHPVPQEPSDVESPEYVVDFTGADADLLLERNGALLDALEHVVLKAVRLREEHFGKITFDCNDWRRLRAEELKLTAQIAAERVVETGDPFALSPMSPRERRIIHLALRDRPDLRTVSEGVGPERRVVILPAAPPTTADADRDGPVAGSVARTTGAAEAP